MMSMSLEPNYQDTGVGGSMDIEAEDLVDQEEPEILVYPSCDENEPKPTPLPEEHKKLAESQFEDNQQPKRPAMADVVWTLMIARNWLLNRTDEDAAYGRESSKSKLSSADDPFLSKFSVVGSEAPNTLDQCDETDKPPKPSFLKRFRLILLKPVNPSKDSYYYWTIIVTLASLYNLLFIFARTSFDALQTEHRKLWLALDYFCDFIYLMDMVVLMKKGYLEQGIMVLIPRKLALNYMKSWSFAVDLFSLFPTDLAYLFLQYPEPLIRANRILRCRRITDFTDRVETRTNLPNLFRISKMVMVVFVTFHLNACLFYEISKWYGEGTDGWVFDYGRIKNPTVNCHQISGNATNEFGEYTAMMFSEVLNQSETCRLITYSNISRQYTMSFYWSALTLTAIGEQPRPEKNFQYVFVTVDIILGMLIFATIVGNVGSMISNMNAAEAEFVERLDGVKQFMEYRKCNPHLRKRVVNWFSYIWGQKQLLDESAILDQLPTKLKAELAIHVHMETLKRVRIFQDCESGLLVELVLKLKLQVFSPGDYICRKGDIGKEMYIVKRGSLNVVSDDGKTVFVTLKAGSVFGELSILNIPGNKTGNRRTASVRSVGYSDLFVLSKDDLWDALREYPDAKRLLLQKGREILKKDNLLEENVKEEEEVSSETLDQKLARMARQLQTLEENFNGLYDDFAKQSSSTKQRITQLENIYKEKKNLIKRDCMRGLL